MAGEMSIACPAGTALSEVTVTISSLEGVPESFSLEQEGHFGKGNVEIAAYSDPEHRRAFWKGKH